MRAKIMNGIKKNKSGSMHISLELLSRLSCPCPSGTTRSPGPWMFCRRCGRSRAGPCQEYVRAGTEDYERRGRALDLDSTHLEQSSAKLIAASSRASRTLAKRALNIV